jgi:hydrogenase/urease accessory protein HupE
MKRSAALVILQLALATSAFADVANPSTLVIEEISPSRFTVELTLPVINGRLAKVKPILPEIFVSEGEPQVRGDASKVIRTWTTSCDPGELPGAPVGVHGLLGTERDVLLTIQTLDGRRHERKLLPTHSFFIIPQPPTLIQLASSGGWLGSERLLRRPELALLILVSCLIGLRRQTLFLSIVSFAAAQAFGQWLASQDWIVMSDFIPQIVAAGVAWLFAVHLAELPVPQPSWFRPVPLLFAFLGVLYGATRPETVPTMGLSAAEQGISLILFAAGALTALLLLTLAGHRWNAVFAALPEPTRDRWTRRVAHMCAVLAGGVFLHGASAPFFGGPINPTMPMVTLVAVAALGLWCRRDYGSAGIVLATVAGTFCAAGVTLGFHVALPLSSVAVFGLLALVGARLLLARRWPLWLGLSVVGLTALYQGHHAGVVLRHDTMRPVANAVGMGVLQAAVFALCYRAISTDDRGGRLSLRIPGLLAIVLAGLWQLVEYREWVTGPVAADLAMGLICVPLPALVLLLGAWLAWPRRRRFAPQIGADASHPHLALLGLAFFVFPIGALRVDIPLHAPDAPSAAEARGVMGTLLTDTYLAFNLSDEDAAFDRLAQNLSQELVADVYLDSRRRLTAGTREGAEVTVQDVRVMEVDDPIDRIDNAFTYPCQWVVTARVRHLKHVHDRQNVYVGELTIRVEDDRWKIAALDLRSEERVVVSWRRS